MEHDSRRWPRLRVAALASAFFLAALGLRWPIESLRPLGDVLQVLVSLAGVCVIHRCGPRLGLAELGLRTPVRRALAFAGIVSLPTLIAFATVFEIKPRMTLLTGSVPWLIESFAHVVLFQGFLFRQLHRRAKLGFWPSALIPVVLFVMSQLYQSPDPGTLAGIFLMTAITNLGGCWVFMRWRDNSWVPIALSATISLWPVFAIKDSFTLDGSALARGGNYVSLGLAILLTIYRDRLWKPLPVEAANVQDLETAGARLSHVA